MDGQGNTFYKAAVGQDDGIDDLSTVYPGDSVSGNLVFSVRTDRVSQAVLEVAPWAPFETISGMEGATYFALQRPSLPPI